MLRQTERLIEELKKRNIDIYLITDTDDHQSEYCGEHFHALKEFSGFSGGDGKLVVTSDGRALLWTDGRYFIQAEEELKNSGIELMRMGEEGVPTAISWICEELPEGGVLGFDGKCISCRYGEELKSRLGAKTGGKIISIDLCDELWDNRPPMDCTPCWILDEKYCGESATHKLKELREKMREAGADIHAIAALDDIAWLLNMRANDIPCNPVFTAFMLVTMDEAFLYIDEGHFFDASKGGGEAEKLPGKPASRAYLNSIGVSIKNYEEFYGDIKKLADYGSSIWIDPERCSFELVNAVPEGIRLIKQMNPATAAKCKKNETEIKNLRIAQHKDSVALTRFMYWFKKKLGIEKCFSGEELIKSSKIGQRGLSKAKEAISCMTEWSCVEKLHEFRAMQEDFIEESFSTISAYGANAAMAHYSPSPLPEKTVIIEKHGLYLTDSGGQYPEGTTDVTRTFSCGPITKEEGLSFTLTVIAGLRLADEKFIEGTSGLVIDGAARDVFWRRGLNFNHGTGHGVGFCLNVHEAPTGIRYRASDIEGAYPMYEGMYVSDEPGMYVEGKYGIRTENMLLVKHDYTNEYGRFMSFEIMNFCPIDKSCLETAVMEKRDIDLLNAYHKRVYDELCDDMNEEERNWLREACAPI